MRRDEGWPLQRPVDRLRFRTNHPLAVSQCNSLRVKTLRPRKLGWTSWPVFERLPNQFSFPFRFVASITMTSFLRTIGKLFRSGHWWLAVAFVLALGVSGCNCWDMRGEGYPDDDISTSARNARSVEAGNEGNAENSWFFNEKARQIDRNFHRQ